MFTITIEDQNGQVADSFSFDHGSYTVGRLDSCDVVLPSASVSRRHARIFIDDGHCYVEDLGSANGVIVDGQRVIQTRDLGTASQIRIGDFYLYLEYQRPGDRKGQDVLSTLFIDSGSEHHKLVRINDSFAGEEFSLSEQENTIGRTDDNFILLSDSSISRRHAVIHKLGDLYMVEDLGSSNGTRLNGKPVHRRQELSSGDIVEFGSVEFVFIEGDRTINPHDYRTGSVASMSLANYGGVAALLVVGLVIGAVVIFGIFSLATSSDDGEPADPLQAQITELVEHGEAQMGVGNWDGASAAFDEALQLAHGRPEQEEIRQFREQVDLERLAEELLNEGELLSEEGYHTDAREVLLEIPEGTRAHQRAEPTLAHLDATISHSLRSEARRLLRRGDEGSLLEAHEKAARAYAINPAPELENLVLDVEDRLDDEGIEFQPVLR